MDKLAALQSVYRLQSAISIYQNAIGAYAEIGFKTAVLLVRSGPAIKTITTLSGAVFVASTVQLLCEEAGFLPQTGYTEFVAAASATLFSGGMTLTEVSNQLRGIIDPLRGTKNGRLLTGRMVNQECLSRNKTWTEPPYRHYTLAAEGRLAPGTRLIRFYTKDLTRREGSFTTFVEDAKGLSYAQVQRKFALPFRPDSHVYADGSNIKAVVGIAGRNFDQPGNGRQVELLEQAKFIGP